MKAIDLSGQIFGSYTVINRVPNNERGQAMWNCSCKCGKTAIVSSYNLRKGLTGGSNKCRHKKQLWTMDNWNDGSLSSKGKFLVYRPDYPRSNRRTGMAFRYHVVWWLTTGEVPPQGIDIHHKNEIKTDDRFHNLELMEHGEHARHHISKAWASVPQKPTKPAPPRSLCTGGAGMIGSHVVDCLIGMGHDVIVLDDLSGGFKENVNPAATLIVGSITDTNLISEIFKCPHIDYVYHMGAYAAEGLSHFIRRYNYTNNLLGSINLINASINHGIKCFIFTSSIAVYGYGSASMVESNIPTPSDPYGISKLATELDIKSAHEMFGLDYTIFRPHNVYGERQNLSDPYRNVIGIFMNQCMNGEPLTIFGDGKQSRAFTHISDVAPIIANSINNQKALNATFNIGSNTPYSVNRLAEAVQQAMGTNFPIRHLEERHEAVNAISDHRKCQKAFGYTPSVTLENGLARMAAWAKQRGPQKGKPFTNIEVEKNMPPSWRQLSWHGCPLP